MRSIFNILKGGVASMVLYPLSQRYLSRNISGKCRELYEYDRIDYSQRRKIVVDRLIAMLNFAATNVPYYRELLVSIGFDPESLRKDIRYFEDVPFLTKDILIEQGERLLRDDIAVERRFAFKTGGSTGDSVWVHYDQDALDWSSAITLYARNRIGHQNWKHETHFASQFPEKFPLKDRLKEHIKCFIMNRSNIFFDTLNSSGLDAMLQQLRRYKPSLVHAHPSTIYALATYCRDNNIGVHGLFDVFESSGELLDMNKRGSIEEVFGCRVVDRYGLAEFGVAAYQLDEADSRLQVFDSFVYPETGSFDAESDMTELVLTSLTNHLMPLIRYRTGDGGHVEMADDGMYISELSGRVHDIIELNGKIYPTHYIQDVLDRIGGIREFQILRFTHAPAQINLVPEQNSDPGAIERQVREFWGGAVKVGFVSQDELAKVGWREKFRYVVDVE